MTDQIDFLNNLTDVHAGQYLALNDGGSSKIVQVQESGVNDSYNLEPVDIENIDLDLSADYDLLQQLVASASSQKLDLSTLIINQLRSYPDQVKKLGDAENSLSVANQKVADQEKTILDLQNEKQELKQEINDLKKLHKTKMKQRMLRTQLLKIRVLIRFKRQQRLMKKFLIRKVIRMK